jgi:hypothetical protein
MEDKGIDLLLKAADISFDRRKVLVAIGGMIAIAIVVALPSMLALRSTSLVVIACVTIPALIAGWVILWWAVGTIARLSYEDLVGEPERSLRDALTVAGRRLPSLLLSPLLLVLAGVAVVVVELIIFAIGRIPYVGELWAACWFLPLIVVNLAVLVIFMLGFWIMPFVIVGEETGVIDTLPRTVKTVLKAPGQIFTYLILTAVVLGLIAGLLSGLISGAIANTSAVAGIGLGAEKTGQLLGGISGLAPQFGYGFYEEPAFTMRIAQWILIIAVLIAFAAVSSLFLVLPLSLGCAVYLSVREEDDVAPSAPAKACANCGAPVGPDDRFCLRCGAAQ